MDIENTKIQGLQVSSILFSNRSCGLMDKALDFYDVVF